MEARPQKPYDKESIFKLIIANYEETRNKYT